MANSFGNLLGNAFNTGVGILGAGLRGAGAGGQAIGDAIKRFSGSVAQPGGASAGLLAPVIGGFGNVVKATGQLGSTSGNVLSPSSSGQMSFANPQTNPQTGPPSQVQSPAPRQNVQSTGTNSGLSDFFKSNPAIFGGGSTTGGGLPASQSTSQPVSTLPNQSTPGDVPNRYSSSPFINAINTQQSYASGVGNPAVNAATQGLLGIAGSQTPDVLKAKQEYADFAKRSPLLLADVVNNPNVAAEVSAGRGAQLGQILSGEQQALAQNVQNALAGQGQQITAGGEAGGLAQGQQSAQIGAAQNIGSLAQPQGGVSYFGNPVTGNIVGSGQGGTGNTLIDSSLNNAMDIISRGGSTDDAMAALVGGDVAKTAFINKMKEFDPNWTPTSSNAIAAQNMKQGQGFQGQAATLGTVLQQFRGVSQPVLSLIQGANLNPSNIPYLNQSLNSYISHVNNPAATAGLTAGINEMKNYVSAILGAGGDLTPTEVTNMTESIDFGNFNQQELSDFLNMIDNYGQIRLSGFQGSAQQSYGGNIGFQGGAATPSSQSVIPQGYNDPYLGGNTFGQTYAGAGLNILGGIEGAITGLASRVLQ